LPLPPEIRPSSSFSFYLTNQILTSFRGGVCGT
jgi:hypothetical protein